MSSKEKSWFEIIQEKAETVISDEDLKHSATKYPHNPPSTKEAYYFRQIFTEIYGAERQTVIPHYWLPKWDKTGALITGYVDPSARTLAVYDEEWNYIVWREDCLWCIFSRLHEQQYLKKKKKLK